MDNGVIRRHRVANILQSAALLGGMALIFALSGWIVGGLEGLVVLTVGGLVLIGVTPRASPRMILRTVGAQPLDRDSAPGLYAVMDELAARAGLKAMPLLCLMRSDVMTAFTITGRDRAYVILSAGLIKELPARETIGVMSHEVAHIRNSDIWILSLADMVTRLTFTMALFGVIILFSTLIVWILGDMDHIGLSPFLILVLIVVLAAAPGMVVRLQLALSRTREFRADLEAAELSGDPEGLAQALYRLEKGSHGLWEQLFGLPRHDPVPSFLRTHPKTEERVRRLMAMAPERGNEPIRPPERMDRPSLEPAGRRLFPGPWR